MDVEVTVGTGVGTENRVAVGATVGAGVAAEQADRKTEISPANRMRRFILPPY
jgi:hypothetical protein